MTLYCSFCGKKQIEVPTLIQSDTSEANICNECITLCHDILIEAKEYPTDDESKTKLKNYINNVISDDPLEHRLIKKYAKYKNPINPSLTALMDFIIDVNIMKGTEK